MTHVRHIEVQEQAQRETAQPQIGEHLRTMHRQNAFNALEFDNEAFFDDVVDSEGSRKFDTVVDDGQVNLVFEAETSARQLVGNAGMVGAFEDSSAERRMDLQCGFNDQSTDLVWLH